MNRLTTSQVLPMLWMCNQSQWRIFAQKSDFEKSSPDTGEWLHGRSCGRLVECSFLIPKYRDAELSDGLEHHEHSWEWLRNEMFNRFHGVTMAPGFYAGYYADPDTGERVADQSLKFIVAIDESVLDEPRGVLATACVIFAQKCIYLSVAGSVEFIEASDANAG